MDIPPAHLIRQAQLVMAGGIELVECAAGAVTRILVAGGEVILRHQTRLIAQIRERVAGKPVPGPGAHVVGSERSNLAGDLGAIIKVERKLADPPKTYGLKIQMAWRSFFTDHCARQPPEHVRLNG